MTPHPRDGSRSIHSAEVLEAHYEEALDQAGTEREAALLVGFSHAIYTIRCHQLRLAEWEAWERYIMAQIERLKRYAPEAIDEDQVESPHYRDGSA